MIPVNPDDQTIEDNKVSSESDRSDSKEKLLYQTKKVTQSDATGNFSVQKYHVDYIFPKLDYMAAAPVQILSVKDIHEKMWNFRHILIGKNSKLLLTTDWTNFVIEKRLVAGDTMLFLRSEGGDLFVAIRRSKRLIGLERLNANSVIEAASLAAGGKPVEVVYYPNFGTPEYFVKAAIVEAALKVSWCVGMKIKMPIWAEET